MNVSLIGVPIFWGSGKKGVELGPEKLRENDIVNIIKKNNHTVYDMGNIYVRATSEEPKETTMKYIDEIIEMNTNLAHSVFSALSSGSFPFVVGGDHSLGIGSISGASKFFDNLGVIWIDAHGDVNTYETTPTGNVHGMPLSAAIGIGYEGLSNLYFKGAKVSPQNVFIIGARDLDAGEKDLIQKHKINLWTTEDIKNNGVEKTIQELKRILKERNISNIHLSFDIDSLDSSIVPGTGTPVSEGLSLEEAEALLTGIYSTHNIKSTDFVEFNTNFDKNDITLKASLKIVELIFKNL